MENAVQFLERLKEVSVLAYKHRANDEEFKKALEGRLNMEKIYAKICRKLYELYDKNAVDEAVLASLKSFIEEQFVEVLFWNDSYMDGNRAHLALHKMTFGKDLQKMTRGELIDCVQTMIGHYTYPQLMEVEE